MKAVVFALLLVVFTTACLRVWFPPQDPFPPQELSHAG
jgi:hypothetical protein